MARYLIRIVNVDSYMCSPIQGLDVAYSEFRGTLINQVPILRVFGSTSLGQKICVHVHGVFPYFYIPYDGCQEVDSLMHQVAISIDKAVNISLNQASSNTHHVYKISLVSGIPMYGYHNKKHQFLKVYLYNPLLIRKVSNLLMNEATLGKLYQPHETHLNFPLQFMIDYNLHGMSYLLLSNMKFRMDCSEANQNISPELFLPASVSKMSVCELEGDAYAEHIINREEVASGNIASNPGIAALWADEKQRRRNKGETSQIEHLLELKRTNITPTKSHQLYKQGLLERLAILSIDKSVEEKLNLSVYPAESPDDMNIQNASLIDLHTPTNIEISLDDVTAVSSSDLDDTLVPTQRSELNISLDTEAKDLLEILEHLGENVNGDLDDDCILTQIVKEDEEDEDKYQDLSIPLGAVTTPKKIIVNKNDSNESDDELYHDLDKTLIPQLDGEWDSAEEETLDDSTATQCYMINNNVGRKLIKKLLNTNVKQGRSMPLLDTDHCSIDSNNILSTKDTVTTNNCSWEKCNNMITEKININVPEKKISIVSQRKDIAIDNHEPLKRKIVKKPPHVKLQEAIRLLSYRIKKLKRQDQLIRIIRKLQVKEHNICVLLSKKGKPKFNVMSKHAVLSQYNKKQGELLSKVPIINDILYQTSNHIDPDLHMIVHLVDQHFLYTYNKNVYPNITEIPHSDTESNSEMIVKRFMDEYTSTTNLSLKKSEPSEDVLNINLEKETLPTVLLNDLPEFLKLSIINFVPNSLNVDEIDLDNNNYIKDACLSRNSENAITKRNNETLLSHCGSHENIQKTLYDISHKKIIDADNKENIYIFSSKYLTQVTENNLNGSIRNCSVTKLREWTDHLKQQLLQHVDNLKKSVSCKHLILGPEDCIQNKICDNENIKNNQDKILVSYKENNNRTFKNYNNALFRSKKCSALLNNIKVLEKNDLKYNMNTASSIINSIQNNFECNSRKTNRSKKKNYKNHIGDNINSLGTCDKLVSHDKPTIVMSNFKVLDMGSGKLKNNKRCKSNKKSDRNTRCTKNPLNGIADASICELDNVKGLRRSLRINSPEYKKKHREKFDFEALFYNDSDSCSRESVDVIRKPKKNKTTTIRNRPTCKTSPEKRYPEDTLANTCKLDIRKNSMDSPKNNNTLCLSFDGTRDSSSSEGESDHLEYRRRLRKRTGNNSPRYSALPVSVSSPRSKSPNLPAGKHLVSLNTNTNFEKKKTPLNASKNRSTVCDNNIKRRLNFNNISTLQTTFIEENIVCTFSPKRQKEHFINDSSIHTYSPQHVDEDIKNKYNSSSFNDNLFGMTSDKTEHQVDNNIIDSIKDTVDKEDHRNLITDHSDSLSQLDSDEVNTSFFKSPQIANKISLLLTTAEKYDKETNFNALQGTSKTLTPKEDDVVCLSGGSSGSSSFGVLTPYQRVGDNKGMKLNAIEEDNEKEIIDELGDICDAICSPGNNENKASFREKNAHVHDLPSNSYIVLNSKRVIITPVRKAPSKEEIYNSLDKYKIPHVVPEIPFYSNVEDVTGSVEIGYNVLRISSKTTAHLPEFQSQTDSINKFRKDKLETLSSNLQWKKSNIKNITLGFCKDRRCLITPAKRPPTVDMIKNWIKEKSRKISTPVKKIEKIKVFVPLSPGNDNDGDDDNLNISLTISPCTPTSSDHDTGENTVQTTPRSSTTIAQSSSQSPVLGHESNKRKKGLKKKLSQSSNYSLRKSLLSQGESFINQSCQITGIAVNNTYGFAKSIENLQEARALIEHQHLTLLVMEVHTRTRGDLKPNPEHDSIRAIFYAVLHDVPDTDTKLTNTKGIIAINSLPLSSDTCLTPILNGSGIDCNIDYVDSEENLINEFLKLMKCWDPDIIAGYEIEMLSWGYLIERAYKLGINLRPLLGRTKENSSRWRDEEGQNELKIIGRIVLDVWRLMRHEIALQSYTFESIVYHILHKRVPQYPFKDLSFWWDHRSGLYRHRTTHYYLFRVVTVLELFDKLDLIGRTSELARLFGIQFYEVLSRGSQFRVESMMLRLAKPLNFIPVSPNVQQRANMKAPEYIPLILEPESKLYNDPVIVLDFQSLYPSMIIAYNYCFTTCVGRAGSLGKNTPFQFGATQLKVSRKRLEKLIKKDLLNFSPCGVGFVKKEVRDGILPRMLREILDTRLMVKNSMKENHSNEILQKVLHNRQLGLKLIANVTYGYTAANFSGRMPCVEVADSVVSKGRETLQRAIEMVESTPEWGARVVYGDTDSLFVLVPGRSRQYAFEVGKKIAEAVTKANPDPVKLKLEKVYQPCVLQTKKRYVGYMYESPDQKEPVFDAKGIETVRRDGCPAVSKMLEKCLRILFDTKDVSHVKKYVLRQFNKIIAGRASIQDLTFAKEYRGASGYRPGACVPALELARKWKAVDKRKEPRSGERVPYIIVSGPPGLPLIRLVRSPADLLADSSLRPNALYYITRVIIPPINRCFNLIGADLNTWFNQMPRKQLQYLPSSVSPGKKSTISQYFSTTSCVACGEQTQTGICNKCKENPQITTLTLMEKMKGWEEKSYICNLICQFCTSTQTEIKCVSLDCPILYRRIQSDRDMQQATYVRQLLCSSDFSF